MSKVIVIYQSFTGNTERMAKAIAEGAKEVEGVDVIVKKTKDANGEDFTSADAVAFGAPNTFGGMAGSLHDFFDRTWSVHDRTSGKPAVAFSSENPNETAALKEIEKFFSFYGLKKVSDGVVSTQVPDSKKLEECKLLGKKLAKASLQ